MQPHVAPIQSFPYSHLWHRELQRSCVVMSPPLPGALLLPSEWGRSQQPLLLALSRPTFSPWMDSGRSPCVSALPKRRNVAGIAVQSAKDRSGSWVVTVFLSRRGGMGSVHGGKSWRSEPAWASLCRQGWMVGVPSGQKKMG
ncbi:hypothetical protein E2320_013754, partial [Naja naja]